MTTTQLAAAHPSAVSRALARDRPGMGAVAAADRIGGRRGTGRRQDHGGVAVGGGES